MNLLDSLDIPVPYLIQKKTDFSSLDSQGWSMMHYAVATNRGHKIDEFLACDIDFNINSNMNKIPTAYLISKGKDDMDMYSQTPYIKIPYCEEGYTALHLNLFLHRYYSKKIHMDYRNYSLMQLNIFDNIIEKIPHAISWHDSHGLSVTDYSILSIDVNFLEKIIKIDPSLQSLHAVEPLTAKKIFEQEVYGRTHVKHRDINVQEIGFMREMIEFFNAKHTHDNLEKNLALKEDEKSGRIKI